MIDYKWDSGEYLVPIWTCNFHLGSAMFYINCKILFFFEQVPRCFPSPSPLHPKSIVFGFRVEHIEKYNPRCAFCDKLKPQIGTFSCTMTSFSLLLAPHPLIIAGRFLWPIHLLLMVVRKFTPLLYKAINCNEMLLNHINQMERQLLGNLFFYFMAQVLKI